jgi:hypothetical protein
MNNKRKDLIRRGFILAILSCIFLSLASCRKKSIAEIEPNDKESDATVMEAGIPLTGTISSSRDKDIFTIEIEEDTSFDISLSAVKGVNHALRIWKDGRSSDTTGKLIDDARKSSPEMMSGLWMNRGRWFIAVTHGDRDVPQGAPDIRYTLKLTPHDGECTEREPNDAIDQANPIDAQHPVSGFYSPAFNKLSENSDSPIREEDWFSFTVEAASDKPTVLRTGVSAVAGVTAAMELYAPDRTIIGRGEGRASGTPVSISDHVVTESGTYYLCVHSRSYESNPDKPYTLSITFPEYDPAREAEPNDTAESANTYNPPSMTGTVSPSGDRDFFSCSVERPSLLRLEVTVPASIDILARIWSKDAVRLCELSGNGGSKIVIPDLYADEQLFCEISGLADKNDAAQNYQIALTSSDYTPDMEKEPNDAKSTATKFAGQTMNGYLTFRGDHDWYLYECPPRSSRTVSVTGIEGASFTLSITDQRGNVIRTEKIAGKKQKSFKEFFDKKGYLIIESQKEITTEPYSITVK